MGQDNLAVKTAGCNRNNLCNYRYDGFHGDDFGNGFIVPVDFEFSSENVKTKQTG